MLHILRRELSSQQQIDQHQHTHEKKAPAQFFSAKSNHLTITDKTPPRSNVLIHRLCNMYSYLAPPICIPTMCAMLSVVQTEKKIKYKNATATPLIHTLCVCI